ncbi:MAG: hypothetical protein KAX93_04240 [Flavobacterium sp.]|nr:hypothetical protein [Flavobacterium sp.]
MKHLLTTLFTVCLSFSAAVAQEKVADKAPQEKTMSKEDKAAAKAKKEADLQEAFKTAGLTADEQQKFKVIIDESSALNKAVKADTSLTDDEKMTKSKENTKARDAKVKELLGEAKYKALKDIQKAQKEAAGK